MKDRCSVARRTTSGHNARPRGLTVGEAQGGRHGSIRDVRTTVRVGIPNPSGGAVTWAGAIVRVDPLGSAPADAGPVVTPPQAPRAAVDV